MKPPPSENHDLDLPVELRDALTQMQRRAFDGAPVNPNGAIREFVADDVTLADRPPMVASVDTDVFDVTQLRPGGGQERAGRRSMLAALAAAISTATGKLALSTGVAAAAVVGAHATGAIDVPLLPDREAAVVASVDEVAPADHDAATDDDDGPANVGEAPTRTEPTAASDDEPSDAVDDSDTASPSGDDVVFSRSLLVDVGSRRIELEVVSDDVDLSAADATCDTALAAIDPELSTPAWAAAAAEALGACNDFYERALGDAWRSSHALELDVTAEGFDFSFDLEEFEEHLEGFGEGFSGFGEGDGPMSEFDLDDLKKALEEDAAEFDRFFSEDFDPDELERAFEEEFNRFEEQHKELLDRLGEMDLEGLGLLGEVDPDDLDLEGLLEEFELGELFDQFDVEPPRFDDQGDESSS